MRKWKITYVNDNYQLSVAYTQNDSVLEAAEQIGRMLRISRVISIVEELEV